MTNMDEWLRFTGIPGIPFTSAGSPAAGALTGEAAARHQEKQPGRRRVKIPAVGDYFSPQIHSSWPARAESAVIDPAIRDQFALNRLATDMSALW